MAAPCRSAVSSCDEDGCRAPTPLAAAAGIECSGGSGASRCVVLAAPPATAAGPPSESASIAGAACEPSPKPCGQGVNWLLAATARARSTVRRRNANTMTPLEKTSTFLVIAASPCQRYTSGVAEKYECVEPALWPMNRCTVSTDCPSRAPEMSRSSPSDTSVPTSTWMAGPMRVDASATTFWYTLSSSGGVRARKLRSPSTSSRVSPLAGERCSKSAACRKYSRRCEPSSMTPRER